MAHDKSVDPRMKQRKKLRRPRRRPKAEVSREIEDMITRPIFQSYSPTVVNDPHARGEGGRFA